MPTVAVLPFYRVGASPLALEIMRVYNAGSSVYASVYVDANGTIPMGNSDLVPIQADAYGLFPVVFVPIGAAYDIKFYSLDLTPRDTYQGIRPAGGSGTSGDVNLVKISAGDSNAGYLGDKLLNGPSGSWVLVDIGGYQQLQFQVNASGILDGKVKADAADGTALYLSDKLVAGNLIGLTLVDHQISIGFTGPAYVPQAGGTFTGAVTFGSTLMATGGCFFGETIFGAGITVAETIGAQGVVVSGTLSTANLELTGLSGSGSWLTIDGAGTVTRTDAPVNDRKVLYSVADTLPGYLGTKIVAGTGITINTTTDGVNGTVMHINTSALPAVIQPTDQIVVGTGTGVTSSAALKGFNGALQAGNAYIGTSSSQPSNAYFGVLGGDPGGGETTGVLVNSTNLLCYASSAGWVKTQVGAVTVSTIDTTLAAFYVPAQLNGTLQLTGVPGVGTAGKLVVDTAGNVSVQGGSGTDYYQTNRAKASPYSFGTSAVIFNDLLLTLPAGTYHVSATAYVEASVTSGTSSVLCSAETSLSVITTDGYTGYSNVVGTGAQRMIAVTANRKITLGATGNIYFNVQCLGVFTGGICWGSLVAERIY